MLSEHDNNVKIKLERTEFGVHCPAGFGGFRAGVSEVPGSPVIRHRGSFVFGVLGGRQNSADSVCTGSASRNRISGISDAVENDSGQP